MSNAILITKEFLNDTKTSDFYNNCSKIEYFWKWNLGEGKHLEMLMRCRFYLDKNGQKKTSRIHYRKYNGKWKQEERYVRDGFVMPESLAEDFKRILKGESNIEIYYYPKSPVTQKGSKTSVKGTRKIYRKAPARKPTRR